MKSLLKTSGLIFAGALVMNLAAVGCSSTASSNPSGYVPAQTPSTTADQKGVAFQTQTTLASGSDEATTTSASTQTPPAAVVVTPAPDLGASSAGRAR